MALAFSLIAWMRQLRAHGQRQPAPALRERRRFRPETEQLEEQLPPGSIVGGGIGGEFDGLGLSSPGEYEGTGSTGPRHDLLDPRVAGTMPRPEEPADSGLTSQPGRIRYLDLLNASPPVPVGPAEGSDNSSPGSAPSGSSSTSATARPVPTAPPAAAPQDPGIPADAIYAMLGNPVSRPPRKRPKRRPGRKRPGRKRPKFQAPVLAAQPTHVTPAPAPAPAATVAGPVYSAPTFFNIEGLGGDRNRFAPGSGLTNKTVPTLIGTGSSGERFRLLVDGQPNAEGTVGADGTWELAVSGQLSEGDHTVRAVGLRDGQPTGTESMDFSITVDTTPPTVTLEAPEFTTTTFPAVKVSLHDADYPGLTDAVEVDVDRNNDGDFEDAGERTAFIGFAGMGETFLSPTAELPEGTYSLRARARDWAGNVGVSPVVSMQVDPNAGFIGSQPLLELASRWPADEMPPMMPGDGSEGEVPRSERQRLIEEDFRYLDFDAEERVGVNVRVTLTKHLATMRENLEALGMNVVFVAPEQNLVIGYLPPERIHDLPGLDHFSTVTPIYRPMTRIGSVTSQGSPVMLADTFRDTRGVDGTGITIGVISDSVNQLDSNVDGVVGIRESQLTGDLPSRGVQVLQDGSPGDSDEGRAMLEIIHDVAPGADLMFATGFMGPQVMANNILRLEAAGADLIVDDIGYVNSPFFNDGVLAQAADEAAARGSPYFSAAGNDGNTAWADAWRPVNATVGGVTGVFADIDPGPGVDVLQNFRLPMLGPGIPGLIQATFQWDNAFLEGGSPASQFQVPTDMEVLILTADGSQLLARFDTNNANTDEALEMIFFLNAVATRTDFAMAFRHISGPEPTQIKWITFTGFGSDDPRAEYQGNTSAIFGHPAARGAVATAAVSALDGSTVESYTSLGGLVPILFDRMGNRLRQPEIRRKPEVAGPANGNTSFFGFDDPADPDTFPNFPGTSAAAPHVTAAAALLLHKNPQLSVGDIVASLQQLARDVGPVGRDFLTGPGIVQLGDVSRTGPLPDRLELNETSDKAVFMGQLTGKLVVDQMTISTHANGLPDYDWFKWQTGVDGTVTINLSTTSNSGDLELHVFIVDSEGFLKEVAKDTTPGVFSRYVEVRFKPGQFFLVEVKGRNTSLGVLDQAHYELFLDIGS